MLFSRVPYDIESITHPSPPFFFPGCFGSRKWLNLLFNKSVEANISSCFIFCLDNELGALRRSEFGGRGVGGWM